MSLWKDKASKTYKFTFQVNGRIYGGGGFKTKKEAWTAREEKRKLILSGADTTATTAIRTDMAFSALVNTYLDGSQRRHAPKTYKYKVFVFKNFMKHAGDIPISKVTPYLIQDYRRTRASNSNYNRHRKDLMALFEYARRILGIVQVNPCAVIEKLPEEKKPKAIPTQEEFVRMITRRGRRRKGSPGRPSLHSGQDR